MMNSDLIVGLRKRERKKVMKNEKWYKIIAVCLVAAFLVGLFSEDVLVSYAKAREEIMITEPTPTVTPTKTPEVTNTPEVTATPNVTTGPAATFIPNINDYAPNTPTLTALGGSKRVRLTWTKVDGADGYFIYYKDPTAAQYTLMVDVANKDALSYLKTGLTQNVEYSFRVSAYKNVGSQIAESELSTAALAKTKSVPATSKTGKKYGTYAKFKKSKAYTKYSILKKAISSSRTFAIPGLKTTNVAGFECKSMKPQGMCLANGYMLISAYDSKSVMNSVIYVVSKASKSYVTTIVLPSKAKVQGLAFDGTNVWVSKGTKVACFPYSVVESAANKGEAYYELENYKAQSSILTKASSFIGYYDGILWVGAFNKSADSTMYGYSVANKENAPSLVQSKKMSVPSRTQGISFDVNGNMYLTRAYRTKSTKSGYISKMKTYKPSFDTPTQDGTVKKNTALAVKTLPPLCESSLIYGTYTYVLFSGATYSSCKYPVDRVLALKSAKLLS